MGNYRFRFSDMIPNAWFYKLKDMNKSRNQKSIYHGSKKKPQQTSSSSSSSSAAVALSSKESLRQPQLCNQRKSYYFSRDLTAAPGEDHEHEHGMFYDNVETKTRISDSNCPEAPRKSSNKRRSTRRNRVSNRSSPKVVTSSVTAGCSCRATVESVWMKPDSTPEEYPISPLDSSSGNEALPLTEFGSDRRVTPETFDSMLSWSASCRDRHEKDIIMDIENEPLNAKFQEPVDMVDGLDTVSELNLPPIITNPSKSSRKTMDSLPTEPTKIRRSSVKLEERNADGSLSVKVVKEDILNNSSKEQKTTLARRFSSNSQGLKLRTNSPRIANKRIQGRKSLSSSSSASSRKSMSDSFAVVKSSKDPQRDFRDSMVEMIIENNICASKELEDLLACYLSLNSDEYHDLIIRVFKQIWFDIVDIHPK